eukprot:3402676-Prymnesium_polylepis.1
MPSPWAPPAARLSTPTSHAECGHGWMEDGAFSEVAASEPAAPRTTAALSEHPRAHTGSQLHLPRARGTAEPRSAR